LFNAYSFGHKDLWIRQVPADMAAEFRSLLYTLSKKAGGMNMSSDVMLIVEKSLE
jgi:hypothetical protein